MTSRRRCGTLIGLALVFMALSACGGDPDLQALQADPIAQLELPHAVLTDSSEMEAGDSFLLESRAEATLIRTYVVTPASKAEVALDAAKAQAKAAGWTLSTVATPSGDIRGGKQVGKKTAELALSLDGATLVVRVSFQQT